jgi:hypothetical protein
MRPAQAACALLALAALACAPAPSRGHHVAPTRYDIPAGFTGWVTVEYGVAGAPPLPVEQGTRVITVPASGRVVTSTPQDLGIVHNEFFFVAPDGTRTEIVDADLVAPNAAHRAHPEPVISGFNTGTRPDGARTRTFEGFHVGRGPAGDPPRWPDP